MKLYLLMKLLHVLAAFWLIAGVIGRDFTFWQAGRATHVHGVRALLQVSDFFEFLLQRLKNLGFSSKVLYLDKGIASTSILRYLTNQQQPAIIACPIRGQTKGIRALCQGAGSYRTMQSAMGPRPVWL